MGEASQHSHYGPTQAHDSWMPASQDTNMATSQDAGTSGLTQDMASCSVIGEQPHQPGQNAQRADSEGWVEWVEG